MAEDYVRPPLIGREAKGETLAIWRFRIIAITLLLILTALVSWGLIQGLGIGQNDPGFDGLGQLTVSHSAGR